MTQNKFKAKLVELGINQKNLSKKMNINESTLSRKIINNSFTVGDIKKIRKILNLSEVDIIKIFFS